MKKFLLLISLLCFVLTVWAQDRVISGRVTSTDDQGALPGVNVVVKGTLTGGVTDADGRYTISLPPDAKTLIFTFIGFETMEIDIANRSLIDLQLKQDITQLSEVVVVGYSSVQKKELTGAVSSVKGDVISNLPLQSFDRALQGRAAGVQVLSANGAPGGAVSVRIRGSGSISAGNEPLYIVDGIQLNNRNDGGSAVSNNPLAFLNPNDIESMEVLKDAANASIYGAQAANGVVLITTKKGRAGQKTKVNFNYYKGFVEPMPTLHMLTTQQFIQIRQEAIQTSNPSFTPAQTRALTLAGNTTIPGLGFPATMTDAEIAAIPNYDWQKEAFKTGTIDNYELSVSGGNDATTFYTSAAYNRQQGSLIGIDFSRFTGKLNLEHKLNKKLSFDLGLNLSSISQSGPYGDARATTAFGAPQYAAPVILPFNPIYRSVEGGGFFGLPGTVPAEVIVGDLSQNVIANANFIKRNGITNQLVGNLALNYKIAEGLTFRAFGGIDYRYLYTEFYGDPRLSDYFSINGTQTTVNNTNNNLSTNYTLTYSRTLGGRHNLYGLGGFEYRKEINTGNSFAAQSFPSPDFTTPAAAATPTAVTGFWTGFARMGYFGNFKYDFDKKYFFSLTMRYDGSSRFGANNRFGFFPSVSGAWNIYEENFLKSSKAVSDLRLRASWGRTGNDQIGNFDSRSLYGLGGSKAAVNLNFMNGTYDGISGIGPSQMGNPDLRWEKNETINIGIDYGFFNNRVTGSIDAFSRVSKDLLLLQSIPQTSGFNDISKNVGSVKNEGLEFEIKTVNLDVSGFKWTTGYNVTFLRNEVVSLFDGLQVLPGNLNIRVGYPLGTNTGNAYAGVNPANGRPMFYDINGNTTYLRLASDIVPLGHQDFSNMFGGLTNTFSYKGIELSVFFNYDYGRTVGNVQNFRMADNGAVLRNSNVRFFDDRWTTPGQITSVPRPAFNRTENTARISSYQSINRFYEDASFIRLKQVTLAYTFPQSLVSRYNLTSFRIYAQAINLMTWTKWTGYDPEFRDLTPANETARGVEGIIPQTRNFTFGVQIGL